MLLNISSLYGFKSKEEREQFFKVTMGMTDEEMIHFRSEQH